MVTFGKKYNIMIQRIQTIFLALVVVLGVISSFLPILGFTGDEADYIMNHYKTIAVDDASIIAKNMGVGVLQGIVLLVAIATILLYKKRSLQMKLGKLIFLLITAQITAIVLYSDVVRETIDLNVEDVLVSFKIGAIIPVLSLILTYLAIRFIKKDDALVRSAERLR